MTRIGFFTNLRAQIVCLPPAKFFAAVGNLGHIAHGEGNDALLDAGYIDNDKAILDSGWS